MSKKAITKNLRVKLSKADRRRMRKEERDRRDLHHGAPLLKMPLVFYDTLRLHRPY